LGKYCQARPIGTAIACEAEHGHRNQLADKPRCTIWDGTAERVAGLAAAHQGLLEEIWKLPYSMLDCCISRPQERALAGQSPSSGCSTPAAPGGGEGGKMVESVSLASECGSQPTRRRESNAVVSPPSSHSAGLNSPGNPGRNPVNHLRAQLGGARTIRPRREAPNGEGCG
jgi:hypothetical protein